MQAVLLGAQLTCLGAERLVYLTANCRQGKTGSVWTAISTVCGEIPCLCISVFMLSCKSHSRVSTIRIMVYREVSPLAGRPLKGLEGVGISWVMLWPGSNVSLNKTTALCNLLTSATAVELMASMRLTVETALSWRP